MSEYEDIVELGIEGFDRLADKYHDQVYGHLPNVPWRKKAVKEEKGSKRKNSGSPDDRYDSAGDDNDMELNTPYAAERRAERDRDYYEDDRESVHYSRDRSGGRGDSRDYVRDERTAVVRSRDPYYSGGYQVAPRTSSSPYDRGGRRDMEAAAYGYNYNVAYGDGYVQARDRDRDRDRPGPPRRRRSSFSPQRQPRDYSPERERRARSRSPNHHRTAATLIGALAGGVLGHNINKKGEGTGSVLTTVGGAIAGGIVARKGEEWWDERQEREARREERHRRERAWDN